MFTDRFWSKVNTSGPTPAHRPDLGPCWIWTAGRYPNGYGEFRLKQGQSRCAHRVAYQMSVGQIADGLELDHLCRVHACVNPAHLEPVTPRENRVRGIGWAGVNAAKTKCSKGHDLTGANLYIAPNGSRQCRTCRRAHATATDERRKRERRAG